MPEATPFPQLDGHQYISLTTYRKSGEGVATPVWFAVDGGCLYIVTPAASGKVKRIRNNPRVRMAPSDARGNLSPGAQAVEGTATVLTEAAGTRGHRALTAKYGLIYRAFGLIWRLRRTTPVYLEVRPAGAAAAPSR